MSYEHQRIANLNMSFADIAVKLSEGNPGALSVIVKLAQRATEIDPASALGPIGPLFGLDNLACYGSRIWMLYKDVCREDLVKMMAVLRAVQFGFVSDEAVTRAIDGDVSFNPAGLLDMVRERLPDFAKAA